MNLTEGILIRLKDLYDIKILKNNHSEVLAEYCIERSPNVPKIQWVPENAVPTILLYPDVLLFDDGTPNPNSLVVQKGLAEENLYNGRVGDLIQLERIGFGRIDKIESDGIVVNMTEKK